MRELTAKQEFFCREYLRDLNGTQAAIRAGYSERSARRQATEHLSKPHIQARVQALMAKRAERVEVTVDGVVRNIIEDREGAIAAGQWSVAVRCDALLGKHLGMFTQRVELTGAGGGPITCDVLHTLTDQQLRELAYAGDDADDAGAQCDAGAERQAS